jgi:hypothetical protein
MAWFTGKGSLVGLQSSGYQLISARIEQYEDLLRSCGVTPEDASNWLKPAREALENRLWGISPYPKYDFAFARLFAIRNFFCQKLPLPDLVGTILPEIRDDLDFPGVNSDQANEIKPAGDKLRAAIERDSQDTTLERTALQVLSQTAAQAREAHWLKVNMSRNRLLIMGLWASALLVLVNVLSSSLIRRIASPGSVSTGARTRIADNLIPAPASPVIAGEASAISARQFAETSARENSRSADSPANTADPYAAEPIEIWLVSLFGILGGLTSALMTSESVETRISEYYLNRRLLYVRPVIGGIIALVVCDAIWGGFLSIAGVKPESPAESFLVVAFIAGFAERAFVSQLLELAGVNDGSAAQKSPAPPTSPSPVATSGATAPGPAPSETMSSDTPTSAAAGAPA